jgi:hypothetical protein
MKVEIREQIEDYPPSGWVTFESMRQAADVVGCSARQLGQQMAGHREFTKTKLGKVIQIRQHHEQANSPTSPVRVDPDRPQENTPLGFVAASRGWGRVEQALVKVTFAVQWVRSKFNKPRDVV